MKNKKIIIALFCFLLILVACFAACKQNEEDPQKDVAEEPKITLSVSQKNLIVGESFYLETTTNGLEGYSVGYRTDNASIAAVENNGKVTACGEGATSVYAVYSDGTSKAEASVSVIVTFGGYLPSIGIGGIDELTLAANDEFILSPYVRFNGNTFSDGVFAFSSSDNTIAEINASGVITAKKNGTATITVVGTWRGQTAESAPLMETQIAVTVIDRVAFYQGENPVGNAQIYTVSEFDGKTYDASLSAAFTVKINGESFAADYSVADDTVLKEENGKLVPLKPGSTDVTVTYAEKNLSVTFTVEVLRPVKTVVGTPLFGISDNMCVDETTFQKTSLLSYVGASESDVITDAWQNGRALTVTENIISDIRSSASDSRGTAQITFGTNDVVYEITLTTVQLALTDASDLAMLQLSEDVKLTGYCELLRNIDATSITISHNVKNSCFDGVFDGKGYSIFNLTIPTGQSLFGTFSTNAVLKNFALINLTATKAHYLAQSGGHGCTVENVYISLSENTQKPRGLIENANSDTTFKNIIVEYLGDNAKTEPDYSDAWSWQGALVSIVYNRSGTVYAADNLWKNVYLVSPYMLSFYPTPYKVDGKQVAQYGLGANETKDYYGQDIVYENTRTAPTHSHVTYSETYRNLWFNNAYRYESYEALASAARDWSAFDSQYWDCSGSYPVWKNINKSEGNLL